MTFLKCADTSESAATAAFFTPQEVIHPFAQEVVAFFHRKITREIQPDFNGRLFFIGNPRHKNKRQGLHMHQLVSLYPKSCCNTDLEFKKQ